MEDAKPAAAVNTATANVAAAKAAGKEETDAFHDLMCPVSYELPLDPVTAEDGRTYDRKSIEGHFTARRERGLPLTSPVTNTTIGPKLLPNVQLKNFIDNAVKNNFPSELLATYHKATLTRNIQEAARAGDPKKMVVYGRMLMHGTALVNQDKRAAYEWFKRAHEAGCARGTAYMGILHCDGFGTPSSQNRVKGVYFLTMAARSGSGLAAHRLSGILAIGRNRATAEARHWRNVARGHGYNHNHNDEEEEEVVDDDDSASV